MISPKNSIIQSKKTGGGCLYGKKKKYFLCPYVSKICVIRYAFSIALHFTIFSPSFEFISIAIEINILHYTCIARIAHIARKYFTFVVQRCPMCNGTVYPLVRVACDCKCI